MYVRRAGNPPTLIVFDGGGGLPFAVITKSAMSFRNVLSVESEGVCEISGTVTAVSVAGLNRRTAPAAPLAIRSCDEVVDTRRIPRRRCVPLMIFWRPCAGDS